MWEAVSAAAPKLPTPRIIRQHWRNLVFVHWAVAPASIAHFYPPGTEPDIFDGRSYVGVVPFEMADTGFARGHSFVGTLLETNIRLYSVDSTGRRGVVFLALDADRRSVVVVGRTVFGLPYRLARMSHVRHKDRHTYTTNVRWPRIAAASTIEVQAGGALTPGPLEHFLTARWGLHVARAGRTWYLPNEHPAWALRTAELIRFTDDGLLASVGLGHVGARPPDHLAFSDGVPAHFGLPVKGTTPRRVVTRP